MSSTTPDGATPRRKAPPLPAPDVASARARHAILTRHRGAEHPTTRDAARDLRAAQLAEHVRRKVAEWPPLTPEQRARVAALLSGPDDGSGAA